MDFKEAVEELRGFESAPWEYGCSTAIQQAVVTLLDFVRNAEALAGALMDLNIEVQEHRDYCEVAFGDYPGLMEKVKEALRAHGEG